MTHIRTVTQLTDAGLIQAEDVEKIKKVVQQFSLSLTPQIAEMLINEPEDGAIAKQFIPTTEELNIQPKELADPIGDETYTPVKGVIHRYPDRCLLMPVTACPVYCRFCFRREKVGTQEKALSKQELTEAYHYIANKPEIWEVILSGGDPLILKPKNIAAIMNALNEIQHVEVVRIHTRIPVVDSVRVTDELIQSLKLSKKAVYITLHANHASEFTEAAKTACARIVEAGIPMLSQTVLLKGINDSAEAMGELMRTFVKNRIKPYYLHQTDLATGTGHFRTTIEAGQAIIKALRGRYSGVCQPTYVLDLPGGFGKVPIGYSYIACDGVNHRYTIEDYQGNTHLYEAEIS